MHRKSILRGLKLKKQYPFYIGSVESMSQKTRSIKDKYTQELISRVSVAGKAEIEKAIKKGFECEQSMRNLSSFTRKNILVSISSMLKEKREELSLLLCLEAGKPIKDSRVEVNRCIETFDIAAEEVTRISGEYTPYDISESHAGYEGITKRFPIGLVSMITPFNFPLNLAAHKIAPAIAAGCPFILKPSSVSPIGSLILGDILSKTELPKGAFSIVPSESESCESIVTDERIKLLSFTGSPEVGWSLKSKCGKKQIVLELGGNAACIVDENVNISDAVDRIVFGAFFQSGQSCISVQRLYVHSNVYEQFKSCFVEKTRRLKKGDPLDSDTFIGPLIDRIDVERCAEWVGEAIKRGGKILVGGEYNIDLNLFDATVVEDVPSDCKLAKKEVFGPICILEKFDDFKQAVAKVNDSEFGLHAGVFTKDINKSFYAFNNLHVGGVIVNDVPSKRIDSMPYGGIKNSGVGKEGVKYAIQKMTEAKLLLLRNAGIVD